MDEAATILAIQAALHTRMGWPTDVYVERDGADIGVWGTFMVWNEALNVVRYAWAGPEAACNADQIIVTQEPLARAQLRALLEGSQARTRDIADIIVKTTGHAVGVASALSGEFGGDTAALENYLHAPKLMPGPDGERFVFFARMTHGGYTRLAASVTGDGPVHLDEDLPAGAENEPLLSGQSVLTALGALNPLTPPGRDAE